MFSNENEKIKIYSQSKKIFFDPKHSVGCLSLIISFRKKYRRYSQTILLNKPRYLVDPTKFRLDQPNIFLSVQKIVV